MKLLIANRGEIALRVVRTARELGIPTVAVFAADDADTPHVAAADTAIALPGSGPAAYLDQDAVLSAALSSGADAVHPGYGFLAERADFADRCHAAGLTFVGPAPHVLRTFGDKARARAAATAAGVPVPDATAGGADLPAVRRFAAEHPRGVMIKAVAGGGGRGMRAVLPGDDVDAAYRACVSEAELGFGDGRVFAEELQAGVRHIEVQIVGDGIAALAIGDRDCSVQRRHQKLIEVAPAPALSDGLRAELHAAAARLCAAAGYRGVATVEFLVGEDAAVFLEVNPRIQVEHTVTEEVTGVDLVAVQLALAEGCRLAELDLPAGVSSRDGAVGGATAAATGTAVQVRVNLETPLADGTVVPSAGTLAGYTPPTGPGVRVDGYGRPGLTTSARYDSLLAKVIVRAANPTRAYAKAEAALGEFVIDGPDTSIDLIRAVLTDAEFRSGPVDTGYLERRLADLVPGSPVVSAAEPGSYDADVLTATLTGTVVAVAETGAAVESGAALVVLEAMKMEHEQTLAMSVIVADVLVRPGQTVSAGTALLTFVPADEAVAGGNGRAAEDLDRSRADLDEVATRHAVTEDACRPDAVAKRHRIGRRTARENITDLVDPDSFTEYGALVLPAQRNRRSEEDLIAVGPADGLVGGLATIGGREAMVISYDYTVMAGTQGWRNHAKTDRLLEIARRRRVPVVLFAEGGGGRPGDTDFDIVAGLDVPTFRSMGALRGEVPLIGVVSGRCFAGNAALAGVCDLLIATPDSNIGMGGPAMISGGGLGDFPPEAIGPIDVQCRNGVVHLVADDEMQAVAATRRCLGYFTGAVEDWSAPDPRRARHVVPENRLRAYDVRAVIDAIVDEGSATELRRDYGNGMVTALVRVEGQPYALIANSTRHLGGAIDADAADKLADFLELAQAHGLPLISLCDTPGFMVGPDAEEQATVRRFSRLFVVGARLTVPIGAILLRKGYGLGAMAMTGGSFHAPQFTVAWPTGEIGGMGLEGAVRLGFRKELAAATDEAARAELFDQLLALAYQRGRALHAATTFELDDVIDPAATRAWIRTLAR
ncbi:acetyl-CoA carboxylase OS=Tsukamurella paurometabola (strain ATCC 8368 / DSM / CCUG 35730 /CIP 100753 / JCM 10117 / KCTC 9821 / NBRC 16120 / NCIMB 702349/ NCTC 13040) OX=521096 GN=Tpau_1872 PE=3 SV=1 [Tsukamurella paurometabola]|uniref:acetyl-CoA carboxylase n=1 Tax=Tsukamurella paurometabola (strain ATCC 8368 / DSM 20162 / CCUG 35730 / CIP 100753 / JCM 10117 / KCTC 9821 / NBRC 16120 / NCIMB 702349 / NCTC 13040) TaxID=521096 RepID=D5UMY8_TSUPD|nr:carboxyl transferase domain-containing protein [Tsukamurella paurometabola]ADG78485.1 Carbamoyl-phosphate synthase L chain ATP- binding protein [Tsukamurella paurometabola DSM 20162]SUP31862.1 Biotin carboxylase [Tsukamurella paurometabola]